MNNLIVKIPQTNLSEYPIIIDKGLVSDANKYVIEYCGKRKFLIVTNETVYKIWGNKLNIDNSELCILPDGEEYKRFESLQLILDKAIQMKLERKDAIIAFGGGVIGDMAGFAASIYLRGINFVQIPTTLLAQVDSSVGGKVAINHEQGKNLIGSFYQPKLVLTDTEFLKTLNLRQFKTGLAEVLKYAFIEKSCNCAEDYDFLNFLLQNNQKIFDLDDEVLSKLIWICCSIKNCVVFQDEKENGIRAILNFGHTFAHAVEKVTNYSIYAHGEAVAIGMKMAFNLSYKMGLINEQYHMSSLELLRVFDLDYKLEEQLTCESILVAMQLDKKVDSGKLKFILPVGLKEVKIFDNIPQELIKEVVLQEL